MFFMEERILKRISIVLIVITMLVNTAAYPYLPLKVGIHFNGSGVADNYVSRTVFVIGTPILIAVMFAFSYVYKNKKIGVAIAEAVLFILNLWMVFTQVKL